MPEPKVSNPIITLTTDFGLQDPYVAEMKAVILCISPTATIVDITHEIPKFNIRMGAYVLASACIFFPKQTIHVAVVDPGVGTKRRSLLIQTQRSFYVGPDNGVLALAAKSQRMQHIYEISNRKLMLPEVSDTSHGRDVFAPTAAYLANGILPEEFGPSIQDIVTPDFAKIMRRKDRIVGEVVHIDSFGNIITNLGLKDLSMIGVENAVDVKFGNKRLKLKLCKAYGEVEKHKPLALIGSHNFLEISLNQGNAARSFNIKSGDKVTVSLS
jgi:S-adenosylmethionine hydrolase